MTVAHRVTFGVKTSQANTTYEDVLRIWREADAIPVFEHAWLWDHLVPLRGDVTGPALEAWTLLAALAAQTERLRLGVIVTSNRLRLPALLAKMAATVDRISNGRLVFGIGAGGSAVRDPAGLASVRRELDAYGIPVVPTGEAVERSTRPARSSSGSGPRPSRSTSTAGGYQLNGAICEPKPVQRPRPPILIGAGRQAQPARRCPPRRHLELPDPRRRGDVPRPQPQSSTTPAMRSGATRRNRPVGAAARLGHAGRRRRPSPACRRSPTPTRLGDLLLEFIDAGVTHLVLAPVGSTTDRPVRWLADEIVEPVLQELGLAPPTPVEAR